MKYLKCFLLASMLLLASGCSEVTNTSQTSSAQIDVADTTIVNMEENETATGITTEIAEEIGTEAVATEGNTESTDMTTAAKWTETTASGTNNMENYADTAENDAVVGDTGLTKAEWLEKAQTLYETAAKLNFQYLCSSQMFQYDFSNVHPEDTNCYLIPAYTTIEEATKPYYDVFTKKSHASDFEGILLEKDGKLYGCAGERGADITYQGAKVTTLTDITETTLTFEVALTYAEPDDETNTTTKTNTFTLYQEDGVWKVDTFTMPY